MKYAQIFALGTILAMLSLLVGGGCAALSDAQVDRLMASLTDALDAYADRHQQEEPPAAVEPPPDDPAPVTPPASDMGLTGQESGFLWKPSGENSSKLVVLLPSAFSGKVRTSTGAIWSGGSQVERANFTGIGNGDRGHYRFGKAGNWYPSGSQFRVTDNAGTVWAWTVAKTGSRNENLKAAKISEAAAPAEKAEENR